ncbi:hypothetical protein D3C85_728970 [compost metagenome]
MQALRQHQRLAPVEQGLPRQRQLFFRQPLFQVGVGHGADQGHVRGALALLRGQIAGKRGVRQGTQAAEQVDLKRAHGNAGRELVLRDRIGAALAHAARIRADGRIAARILDLVLGPHGFHVEGRHAQIAVVFQRDVDQALQARIEQHLAPAQVR